MRAEPVSRGRLAVAIYVLLAAATLALAEILRRCGVTVRLTRKLVHVVAGSSPLVILPLVSSRGAGMLPYIATIGMNYILWKRDAIKAIGSEERSPGIVYFPVAQTLVLAAWWEPVATVRRRSTVYSALLTLAWSDALAALVGQHFGRHPYTVLGATRTLEGSGAMFLCTALIVALSGWSGGGTRGGDAVMRALGTAMVATVVESLSPRGADNLTVPLSVGFVLARTE